MYTVPKRKAISLAAVKTESICSFLVPFVAPIITVATDLSTSDINIVGRLHGAGLAHLWLRNSGVGVGVGQKSKRLSR